MLFFLESQGEAFLRAYMLRGCVLVRESRDTGAILHNGRLIVSGYVHFR